MTVDSMLRTMACRRKFPHVEVCDLSADRQAQQELNRSTLAG